jgi:hypothetical protein
MSEREPSDPGVVETSLLTASRDPACLERLLRLILENGTLTRLVKGAGRRLPGRPDPAFQLAGLLGRQPGLAGKVAEEVAEAVDRLLAAEATALDGSPLRPLAQALAAGEAEAACGEKLDACAALPSAEERLKAAAVTPVAATTPVPAAKTPPPPAEGPSRKEQENRRLKEQLAQLRRVLSEQQGELGELRRSLQKEEEAVALAEAARRDAERRASDRKRQLKDATAASDREEQLELELEEARRALSIERQKRELVALESEDLRACLEDRDRFDAVAEEEIPSFRDRPLLAREQNIAARLEALAAGGRQLRVLVVGGGEPQFRHRDKLEEYGEAMGFASTWRMAEYTSWHKEMDRLATDMNTRYDALVILHWNRTTFTRKARQVCDAAGHKPCITCYYEGFTSLRETMQTCLEQLLDREETAA